MGLLRIFGEEDANVEENDEREIHREMADIGDNAEHLIGRTRTMRVK